MSTDTARSEPQTPDASDAAAASANQRRAEWLKENRTRVTVLAVLVFLFLVAFIGIERDDWFETIMQGLSVGALTFLVVSGHNFRVAVSLIDG